MEWGSPNLFQPLSQYSPRERKQNHRSADSDAGNRTVRLDHKFRWTVTNVTETHVTESLLTYVCRLLEKWGCNLSSRGVRKIAKSNFVVSAFVRPSVRQHGTTRLLLDGFSWNFYLSTFRKYVEKIHVALKTNKNNGYFTWAHIQGSSKLC